MVLGPVGRVPGALQLPGKPLTVLGISKLPKNPTLIPRPGERGHTPSRGALCQYLAGEGPVTEAKMCPTA